MRKIHLRCRNIEWSRIYLNKKITTLFAYIIKRNAEFGIESTCYDLEEEYAVLRNTMSKYDIERAYRVKLIFH
jgi:hypothetical protein